MNPLSDYEHHQLEQIAGFKAEAPFLFVEVFEKLTHPLVTIAKQFLPEAAVTDAIEVAYKASEVVTHRDEIAARAGVKDVRKLRQRELEFCDKLADEFGKKAGEGAMLRGAAISGAGGAGAVLGLEVMVTYALKTIHTVGFCYGFTPEEPRERDFALSIMLLAAAGSLEEKQQAFAEIDRLKEFVAGELVEDIAKEAVETMAEEALERVMQTTAEDYLSERVLESGALRAIPFLGVLVGAISDAAVAQYIAHVAKLTFQERWFRANRGIKTVAADPELARSRLQRVEGVVSTGAYWTTFLASFLISFPPLALFSFFPKDNSVERGLVEGSSQATRDSRGWLAKLRNLIRGRRPVSSSAQ